MKKPANDPVAIPDANEAKVASDRARGAKVKALQFDDPLPKSLKRIFFVCGACGLAAFPPGAFVAVASDFVQLFAVMSAALIAYLVVVATANLDAGLPIRPAAAERIRARFDALRGRLMEMLYTNLGAILFVIIAKLFCTAFSASGWAGWIIDKTFISVAGGLLGVATIYSLRFAAIHAGIQSYRDFPFLWRHGAWPRTPENKFDKVATSGGMSGHESQRAVDRR